MIGQLWKIWVKAFFMFWKVSNVCIFTFSVWDLPQGYHLVLHEWRISMKHCLLASDARVYLQTLKRRFCLLAVEARNYVTPVWRGERRFLGSVPCFVVFSFLCRQRDSCVCYFSSNISSWLHGTSAAWGEAVDHLDAVVNKHKRRRALVTDDVGDGSFL